MPKIIDTDRPTQAWLQRFKAAGVECPIRYMTRSGGEKCISVAEAKAIAAAGMRLALVFEEWGGAGDFEHGDITVASGRAHALAAINIAKAAGAPDGVILWFAIDTDCGNENYVGIVRGYARSIKATLGDKFRFGLYASGLVCRRLREDGLVENGGWLTQSMGFAESRAYRASGKAAIVQGLEVRLPGIPFTVDPDEANGDDWGAFVPFAAAAPITGTSPSAAQPPGTPAEPPTAPSSPAGAVGQADPVLAQDSSGDAVLELQRLLGVAADGDFGPATNRALIEFQAAHGLDADGVAGPLTWAALRAAAQKAAASPGTAPPTSPPPAASASPPASPGAFPWPMVRDRAALLAGSSALAAYNWRDRGRAPIGYPKGMAAAYALAYHRFKAGAHVEAGIAEHVGGAHDSLAWYGLADAPVAVTRLREAFALLIGLGMRESGGNFGAGRDVTAGNEGAAGTEAGLFQMSYSASGGMPMLPAMLAAAVAAGDDPEGLGPIFHEGVNILPGSWADVGSGPGEQFQRMAKASPMFAVEAAALGLRQVGGAQGHWGPIRRKEAELRPEALTLLLQVEEVVDQAGATS